MIMIAGRVRRRLAVMGAVALGVASLAAACGGDDDTSSATTSEPRTTMTSTTAPTTTPPATTEPTTTEPTQPTTTEPTTTEPVAPVDDVAVNVYWGWEVVNPAAGTPERIGAGGREVGADTPVANSLEALFEGPDEVERSIDMVTSIPPGTTVLGIAVDGDTAIVDLSAEFATSSGSLDETMRLAQVVFTVTQFDGLERVKFQIDGEPQEVILSHGFVVGDGLTRDDFADVRPAILIEQPYPGEEVSNPLVARGESNTFEGTVRYAITSGGGDGLIVVEGFTTATAGMGTWGDFEIVVDLSDHPDDYRPGAGSIIMWEDSPRDGSQVGVVEIPIVLPEL